jgi:hypothetical protein
MQDGILRACWNRKQSKGIDLATNAPANSLYFWSFPEKTEGIWYHLQRASAFDFFVDFVATPPFYTGNRAA